MASKPIFRFSGQHCDWTNTDEKVSKTILGGKGAALVKMAQAGMNVPPGFTITTEVCNQMPSLSKAQVEALMGEAEPIEFVRENYNGRAVETKEQEKYVREFDVSSVRRKLILNAWRSRIPGLSAK